jgi:hypothetical protein
MQTYLLLPPARMQAPSAEYVTALKNLERDEVSAVITSVLFLPPL